MQWDLQVTLETDLKESGSLDDGQIFTQTLNFSFPLHHGILPSVDTVTAINLICSRVKAALDGLLHEEARRIHKTKDPT